MPDTLGHQPAWIFTTILIGLAMLTIVMILAIVRTLWNTWKHRDD